MAPELTVINGLLRVAGCGGPLVVSEAEPCCCPPCECSAFYSEELEYKYEEATGDLGPFCSFTYIKGEQTFTIPSSIPLPVTVQLSGDVNDDLVLNGEVVRPNDFPFGGYPCNGAHTMEYCFTAESRTFTLATKDNYGFGMGANFKIRFCK